MHPLVGDLRRGVGQWGKSRGLAALALVALALGIGATTAIFSVVNAVLLQPLPFRDADRLLAIFEKNIPQRKSDLYAAGINIDEWRQRSLTVSGVAAIFDGKMILTGGPGGRMEAEELKSERVSANLFPLLGVHPVLGRGFLASEDVPGQSNVAVLSYELWQRRFGADPSIPGKSIRLRGSSYTVVGVIIGNMVYLWAFGREIEDSMGAVRYLFFYLTGGVVAMMVQILGDPYSRVPTL